MTSINPQADSRQRQTNTIRQSSLRYGFVDSAFPDAGMVAIESPGESTTTYAKVTVQSPGDGVIPEIYDETESRSVPVIYTELPDEAPVVLGFIYDPDVHDIPTQQAGERIFGHDLTDSRVKIDVDGTIHIDVEDGSTIDVQADGTIVLNDGTQGIITDVNTTKDADGHVTDVSLTRDSNILI